MKKCSTSLAIKEMQIKITLRLAWLSRNNNKYWGECGGNGNHHTLCVGMKIRITTMESSMEAPQKTTIRTTILSSKTTSGNVSEGM
jgi:hypothetical protein